MHILKEVGHWLGTGQQESIYNPLHQDTPDIPLPQTLLAIGHLSPAITDAVSSSLQHCKPPHHLWEGTKGCQWIEPLSFYAAHPQWNLLSNTESVRKIFIRPSASNPTFLLQSLNLQIEVHTCYTHSVKCINNVHIYVLYKDGSIYR